MGAEKKRKKMSASQSAAKRAKEQADAEFEARALEALQQKYEKESKKRRKQKATFYTLLLLGSGLILFSVLYQYGLIYYEYERYYTVLGYCCVGFAIIYEFVYVNPIWKRVKGNSNNANTPNAADSSQNLKLSKKERNRMIQREREAEQGTQKK